jgi:hypothetical protein
VKLSLSNDRPIMLTLKKFIPCYAAALCIKMHSALLALCGAPHKTGSITTNILATEDFVSIWREALWGSSINSSVAPRTVSCAGTTR